MLTFSQYSLTENYKNFIGKDSIENRRRWADQVWDIVQSSYAAIGGIKGSGFNTKEDMITNIPFWKIYTKKDKVIAAFFYKDKSGRKIVAMGIDGSDLSVKITDSVYKASLGVSYGEKSGRALGKMMKTVKWNDLKGFLLEPSVVQKVTGKKTTPISDFNASDLDEKDRFTYEKYPELRPWMYVRELGGEMHLKVSMGTPNLPIFKNS